MELCGNSLPWVNSGKHLGITVENKMNGLKKDMRKKREIYIPRNSEIVQEFYFAHPQTRLFLNKI